MSSDTIQAWVSKLTPKDVQQNERSKKKITTLLNALLKAMLVRLDHFNTLGQAWQLNSILFETLVTHLVQNHFALVRGSVISEVTIELSGR